jgi:hypothetical protein
MWALTGVALTAAACVAAVPPGSAGGHAAVVRHAARSAPTPEWLARALEAGARQKVVPSDVRPSLAGAAKDYPVIYDPPRCHLDQRATRQGRCRYGDPAGKRTIVLFGDSHAAHWFPAVERAARAQHWVLVSLTKSACPAPKVTVYLASERRAYTECDRWRRYAVGRIADTKPDVVVMSSARNYTSGPGSDPGFDQKWARGTASTVRGLRDSGAKVLFLADTPHARRGVVACLARHRDDARTCTLPTGDAITLPARQKSEARAATGAGATLLDPTSWLCTASRCPVVVGKILVYRDFHHMTTVYSHWLGRALVSRLR